MDIALGERGVAGTTQSPEPADGPSRFSSLRTMCFGSPKYNCWLFVLYIVVGTLAILLSLLLWKILGVWLASSAMENTNTDAGCATADAWQLLLPQFVSARLKNTFITLLIVSNLGGNWSATVDLWLVDQLTMKECIGARAQLQEYGCSQNELRFASYYADHMVLQKEPAGAVLWGYGKSDATIMMGLYKENNLVMKKMTQIEGHFGIWKIVLNPMSQGGPYRIDVLQSFKGNNANVTLNDIYFGDVWLCSGQSNMEMPVSLIFNASMELDDISKFPLVRVFAASRAEAKQEQQDLVRVGLQWSVPTAANLDGDVFRFSAVCWLFGRCLFETLKYPIGLLQTTWGGSAIEAWSSKRALHECGLAEVTLSKPTSYSGPYKQSAIWNAMIHPLLNMTLRGVIWYQGETNTVLNTDLYDCMFLALIEDWRKTFHNGSDGQTERFFPFGFVQLSTYDQKEIDEGFPRIRWHQTAGVGYVPNTKMPNTFMAVATDLGDFNSPMGSIHPRDKQTVAYRLHLGARAVAYGEKNLTFQGPYPQRVHISMAEKQIKVTFGQKILLHHLDKKIFEVCCSQANGEFQWKPAPMESSHSFTVTLHNLSCPDSVTGLRYAWTVSPCEYKQCPIYNLQMLPVAPFIIFSEKNPEWIVF